MSHDLFGSRFISKTVVPWHRSGIITETDMTACEALKAIDGNFDVQLHPTYTTIQGHQVLLPNRQIVRHPTSDDREFVLFGSVGPEYELITPQDMAEIWDRSLGKPIETMGLLRRGAMFFCTTKLPTLDIKGDEVEQYLGISWPMDGMRCASAEIWPIRVCCSNTLRAAQASARVQYRVVHDATARERIGKWMADAFQKAEQNYDTIKQVFELLANKCVDEPDAKAALVAVYPFPKLPRDNAPAEVVSRRFEMYEREKPRVEKRRQRAFELFDGDGIGMDTPAAQGTLWGLYNSVTEFESHRRSRTRSDEASEEARVAESILYGDRGQTMQRAFDACLALATDKPLDTIDRQHKAHLN